MMATYGLREICWPPILSQYQRKLAIAFYAKGNIKLNAKLSHIVLVFLINIYIYICIYVI